MKKLAWVLLGVLTFIFTPMTSVRAAANQRGLLLNEVQTGSATSASEEFVELYNQSDQALDLSIYRLQYFSASSTNFNSPTRSIALGGTLYPYGRYLLASTGYLTQQANTSFSASLAKTGGHLVIVSTENSQTIVHDVLGWGTANMPETAAAIAPNSGESLQRKIDPDGIYQDTDNNNQDFNVSTFPTPEAANPVPVPAEPDPAPPVDEIPPNPVPTDPPVEDPTPQLPSQEPDPEGAVLPTLPLQITELLPNPAAPKTDVDDEFIEIYNPNQEAVDLTDYRLETGNSYSYHFTFSPTTIGPQSYMVLYAKDTNLVLSNTSGKARLLDPNGSVMFETSPYDSADEDKTWALIDGTWQWTVTPTPGESNVLTLPVSNPSKVTAQAKPKATAKTTPTSAKKPVTKVASAKTTKPKTSSAKTKAATNTVAAEPSGSNIIRSMHPTVLAVIALIAIGYGAYEYRSDIANKFHKLRNFRKNRNNSGQAP